jgi:hypothetical protein
MINELINIKEERKIVSVYTNIDDTTKFMVGYILGVNDEWFVLLSISPTGMYDGLIIDQVNRVLRMNVDSKYEKKILSLQQDNIQETELITFRKENIMLEFLNFAEKNKHIISVEIENSGCYEIQGYINKIKHEVIIIDEISEYGENDGSSTVNILNITKVRCNSEDELLLQRLNRIHESVINSL